MLYSEFRAPKQDTGLVFGYDSVTSFVSRVLFTPFWEKTPLTGSPH